LVYRSTNGMQQQFQAVFIDPSQLASAANKEGWSVSLDGLNGLLVAQSPSGQRYTLIPGNLVFVPLQSRTTPFGVTTDGQLYFYGSGFMGAAQWPEAQVFSLQQ
jgi:hypothetical protein